MKSSERIVLESLCSRVAPATTLLGLDAIEACDEDMPANTVGKRSLLANAVSIACRSTLEHKTKINELCEVLAPGQSEASSEIRRKLWHALEDAIDVAAISGFVLAKYGSNNEYMDQLAAKFRMHNQKMETMEPELFAKIEKLRKENLNDKVNKAAEDSDSPEEFTNRIRKALKLYE